MKKKRSVYNNYYYEISPKERERERGKFIVFSNMGYYNYCRS